MLPPMYPNVQACTARTGAFRRRPSASAQRSASFAPAEPSTPTTTDGTLFDVPPSLLFSAILAAPSRTRGVIGPGKPGRPTVALISLPDRRLRVSGAVHGSSPHRVSEPSQQSHRIAEAVAGAPTAARVASRAAQRLASP